VREASCTRRSQTMSIALKLLAQIFRTTKTWAYSLSYIAQVILPVLKRVQTLPRFAACSAQNASKRSVYRSAALAAGSYCASVESVNASRSEPPREFSARICRRWSRALFATIILGALAAALYLGFDLQSWSDQTWWLDRLTHLSEWRSGPQPQQPPQ
jgi:hypothetical protein